MQTSTEIPEVATGGKVRRTIAILGAGGDLTERLLLPGIARVADASPDVELHIIGAARTPQSRDEWRDVVRQSLEGIGVSEDTIDALVSRSDFVPTDASSADELRELLEACPSSPLLYVALPPVMGEKVAAALAELDLPDDLRIAIEKPFGESEESARALNEALAAVVPEDRLWRIDHFLGTPAAVELIRSRDRIEASGVPVADAGSKTEDTEDTRDAESPGRVEIIFEEGLGIEGRGAFYDETGALRDMLQSHLMLMLALTAMEQPDGEPGGLDDALAEVLRAVRLWDEHPVSARRARYAAGEVDGKPLGAYVDEDDVDADRGTETLAEITLQVDTPRWRGVPFVLRSAKAIGEARQEIVLTPGDGSAPTRIPLRAPAGDSSADPYARVIAGLLTGNTLLSVRGDVAEELWRIVTPVLEAWEGDARELPEYAAGTVGADA
ncbi:glucose-6-phosphate dehydrogenase [Pseudoclavibacter sp. RFBB5]|uniref:glucose-6-phosphate dehydrogenase n=1 Tax=Pseudoclavibacter sp. RFBB5 TaxID=2080574 RepID=UPI000CE91578|nr:glucose-6-phosphate dehydrogenase [Pseudoclavibacter sp. RFBB5]PPG29070.1 glucose-6-phosphate dehydrogenase [Pseudoclavibacter sp. RFBB5]